MVGYEVGTKAYRLWDLYSLLQPHPLVTLIL